MFFSAQLHPLEGFPFCSKEYRADLEGDRAERNFSAEKYSGSEE